MIAITKYIDQYEKTVLKLNNVGSIDEGWQFINKYAEVFCLKNGFDEYGIEEFYEDKAYASAVYFIKGEIKGVLSFDISEFEKFGDFKANKPYSDFEYTKVIKYQPPQPGLTVKDIKKLLIIEPALREYGILKLGSADDGKLPDPKQVQACIDWLKTKVLIPTKTASFNSSNIKGMVEQELKTYVTGGAAVGAVIILGIPDEKVEGSSTVKVYLRKQEIFGKPKRYDRWGQEIK